MKRKIAFNRGVPPPESFPYEQLSECVSWVLREDSKTVLQYGSSVGYPPLIGWLADRYGVRRDRIITGQGSLQLLDFLVKTCLDNNDLVFVEQPTYDRTLTIFRRGDIRLHGFRLDAGRMNIGEIEKELSRGNIPVYFYLIPDFQNPSGAVMPLEDRKKIAQLAERFSFTIIEDGPYRELRYSGRALPTLFELAPDYTIHMSSFSKLISPGMRVGFMIASQETTAKLRVYAENTYISPNFLSQAAAYEFIRRGWLDTHLESLKRLYCERQDATFSALEEYMQESASWIQAEGGFFAGVFLKDGLRLPSVTDQEEAGLLLSEGRAFFLYGGDDFIRLPFCALTVKEIKDGIQRLAVILNK